MITKAILQKQIEKFPEEFTIDELIEELLIIDKVETGIEQSKKGTTISETELDKEIEKWFE